MPGPAAYGQGGDEATVTDAAVVLGWLVPERPLAGGLTLAPDLAERAVARVAHSAGLSPQRCAAGIVEIATAVMVRALRTVSVERGVDPRNMTLVAFGGAGPMFGCRMAESLGMRRALVPPHAGVLSALGLASAPEKLEFMDSLHRQADALGLEELDAAYCAIEVAAGAELDGASLSRFADCRYVGQGYELTVPVTGSSEQIAAAFHRVHSDRFGHADEERPVEVVNVRVVAERGGTQVRLGASCGVPTTPPVAGRVQWDSVAPGTTLEGPLMLDGLDATARIEEGWRGRMHHSGAVVLQRT